MQPSEIFPPEGKLTSNMMFGGGVRWMLGCEGVLVRFSKPGNTEPLEMSDIQASLFAAAEQKGYGRSAISSQLPVGNRLGPWEQTMAAQLADELVKDDVLTIFRPEEDASDVELEVSILTPFGTKYRDDGKKQGFDPAKMKERAERNQRRGIMYVEYPKFNVDETDRKERVKQIKDKIALHFTMTHNAEEVGFCDCRDKFDNELCKFMVFVHHRKEVDGPTFFARALPGIKFIYVGGNKFAKVKVPGSALKQICLRPCCFMHICIPKPGTDACGAMHRAFQASKIGHGGKTKEENERKRKAQKAEGDDRTEHIAKMRGKTIVECRAFAIGRCLKDDCPAAHIQEPKAINCCTKRFGTPKFKKRQDQCPMTAETCPFANHVEKEEMEIFEYAEGPPGAEEEEQEVMEEAPSAEE